PVHLRKYPRSLPRVLLRSLSGEPYLAGKWDSPSLERAVHGELTHTHYDVVYIDHLGMTRYLTLIRSLQPRARIVLEQHNVESDLFSQYANRATRFVRPVARREARLAAAFEARALRNVEALVAISEEDARRFRAMAGIQA